VCSSKSQSDSDVAKSEVSCSVGGCYRKFGCCIATIVEFHTSVWYSNSLRWTVLRLCRPTVQRIYIQHLTFQNSDFWISPEFSNIYKFKTAFRRRPPPAALCRPPPLLLQALCRTRTLPFHYATLDRPPDSMLQPLSAASAAGTMSYSHSATALNWTGRLIEPSISSDDDQCSRHVIEFLR